MKKLTALLLCLVMVLSLAACGAKNDASTDIPDATTLLNTVFSAYAENEKFPVGGGAGETMVMDAPGALDITDAETVDYMVGLPADALAMVDDAANAMHMMNANTFTAGCFRVADSANVDAVVKALQENIHNRQWMCGFPEGLVIYTVGNYVVSAFGAQDLLNVFTGHLTAAYENAAEVVAEPIA